MHALTGEDALTVDQYVDAPPDQVYDVLSDGWLYPVWVVGASRMRNVDSSWPQPGARLHHSVGVWPLLLNDMTQAREAEPPRRLVLQARGWPAGEALVTLDMQAEGNGTRVRMTEDAVAGAARLVPWPLRAATLRPRNLECLRRLACLAEGRRGA
jgi:uncharacterized protein YndB with AHSA1/START domain